jgi:glutathione S-transferase
MAYTLLIGDRSYSSWSLRGWLPFEVFDIPVTVVSTILYRPQFAQDLADFAPMVRTVPALTTPGGSVLRDSIAIAWHLAEVFPERGLLPDGAMDRALAQSLIAEMHSGFTALRAACPMNLRTAWEGVVPSDAVLSDLARIDVLWSSALSVSGGPFLFGAYTLADAFFAPVAMRIAGYRLDISQMAQAYVAAHLAHGPLRRWRAMGLAHGPEQDTYEMGLTRAPFPVPAPLTARPVDDGPSENDACPYSGRPVVAFAAIGGRVFGFCNAFCRDKTVADPAAWPKFMAIYDS